jgi:methylated-DNA-[protein]-cysteine S-methyltransferase
MDNLITGYMNSPLGTICLQHSGKGLCSLIFMDHDVPEDLQHDELRDANRQLLEYFDGSLKKFTVSLDLQGTEFRKSIWEELLKIKFGQTMTYGELAIRTGDIKAIRAVANANAVNPVSIIVPCHRVIGSDGSLTGYAGGLWRKKWLLEHEQKHHQLSLF